MKRTQNKKQCERSMLSAQGSRGQALMTAILFFVIASTAVSGAIARPVITDVRLAQELEHSKQSYALAEAGAEDAAYRLQNALPISSTEVLSENGVYATTTLVDTVEGYDVTVMGDSASRIRRMNASFVESTGVGFSYGIQSGEGGIVLSNSATVVGNVYSNGPIVGTNSHIIKGDVVSAGPSGLIDGVHATGTAHAHTIDGADIEGDAYYTIITGGTTVDGTKYPGSPDQATSSFPVSDELIDIWKAEAEAGGVYSGPCPYTISSNTTIGPLKIECNLNISGSPNVTLEGAVWVEGNIDFSNSPVVKVGAGVGNKSVPFIADAPAASSTSGKITLQNSLEFQGNGGSRSYVFVVSKNSGAVNGTGDKAITIQNSASGKFLVYAPYGEIEINNSATLKEVTAYRIRIKNSATVIYESGLANLLFTSGPSGGFSIGGWGEGE